MEVLEKAVALNTKETSPEMKIQLGILILCLQLGCAGQTEQAAAENNISSTTASSQTSPTPPAHPPIQKLAQLNITKPSTNYQTVKNQVKVKRDQLATKELSIDSSSQIFKTTLLHQIIPFWEGTEWSFEGHTSHPRSGSIACGYFVSTTLRDAGLQLNRYHLAQQSPINEAKSLAINTEVKEFSEGSVTENIKAINNYLKEGIHFIGFDQSHVGYILKEAGNLYLIHSNYLDAVGVGIEPIEASEVFNSYRRYYIVELSTNPHLIEYWINKTSINIFRE